MKASREAAVKLDSAGVPRNLLANNTQGRMVLGAFYPSRDWNEGAFIGLQDPKPGSWGSEEDGMVSPYGTVVLAPTAAKSADGLAKDVQAQLDRQWDKGFQLVAMQTVAGLGVISGMAIGPYLVMIFAPRPAPAAK